MEDPPSWAELLDDINDKFEDVIREENKGSLYGSVAGLRSRISEYRLNQDRLKQYIPGKGVVVPKSETWDGGLAPIVQVTTNELFELVVILTDIHAPYHNSAQLKAALELIADLQPHVVVINGDTNDFFGISRFNKSNERADELQSDLDIGNDIRAAIRKAAPNAVIRENLGNHDERVVTYIELNAKQLHSLRALKPEKLFMHDELEITLYGREGHRIRPEFVFEHGHVVRKDSGASAKSRLNDTLISGFMGHTHRLGDARRTGYRDLRWFEGGCLCQQSPDYVVGEANWQPGVAVAHFHTKKDAIFNVELVAAIGDAFIFGGKTYGTVESMEAALVY
jgi:predicted phosphodiesterase